MGTTVLMECLMHDTKIERKPKGVEVELMVAACAETKVMIALEIQEGREAMASKEYVDRYTKAGTAVILSSQSTLAWFWPSSEW